MSENLEREKIKIDWFKLALEVVKVVVGFLGGVIAVSCGVV